MQLAELLAADAVVIVPATALVEKNSYHWEATVESEVMYADDQEALGMGFWTFGRPVHWCSQ